MAKKEIVASLDVGTANTRCVIAEVDQKGDVHVIGMSSRPSVGMRKGLIIDLEANALCIKETIGFAERMSGATVSSVYVGLSPLHAALQASRGMVAVLGDKHEVSPEDVERAIQAAKMISLPPNREVLDIISKQYIVDGYGGLKDPVSMVGMRLELEALLVVGNLTALSNLRRSVDRAGYGINGFVLKPLALGELMLSEDERELGVLLCDVGAAAAELSYFEEGTLRSIGVVPIGGASVTNDLALGLRTSTPTAERLKIENDWFGQTDEKAVDLSTYGHVEAKRVSSKIFVEIIEPRYEELFRMLRQQAKDLSNLDVIPAGIVLTGGVAKTKGFTGLAKRYVTNPVRVSLDTYGAVDDPGYNAAVGIITYVLSRSAYAAEQKPQRRGGNGGLVARVKGFLKDFWD